MRKSHKGKFTPTNPRKYKGDPTNIIYRSSWERIFMDKLDRSPNVIEWSSEEISITYIDPTRTKRRVRRYFPDFIFKVNGKQGIKTYMVEIKPLKETMPPKTRNKKLLQEEQIKYVVNQSKWAAAEQYCKERNIQFVVITEKNLGLF